MSAIAKVAARVSREMSASPEAVLAFLRDYRESRPRILTDSYSGYRVEEGGEGDGTVIAFHFAAGGRERDYRLRVQESAGALYERDELSSFVNRWAVTAAPSGSNVTLEASWEGAGGIGGFFERTFAPLGLRRIYGEVLDRLADALES